MSDMNTYVWSVKGLGIVIDALEAAEAMVSPQVIVNTTILRELVDKAEELWKLRNKEAMGNPGPFRQHLNELNQSRQLSELRAQVDGLRHDNLLAASELREFHVADQKQKARLAVLEPLHTRWTEHTEWGVPGVSWAVSIGGLIIPFDHNEDKARQFAQSNTDATVLFEEHTALHAAPEIEAEDE